MSLRCRLGFHRLYRRFQMEMASVRVYCERCDYAYVLKAPSKPKGYGTCTPGVCAKPTTPTVVDQAKPHAAYYHHPHSKTLLL